MLQNLRNLYARVVYFYTTFLGFMLFLLIVAVASGQTRPDWDKALASILIGVALAVTIRPRRDQLQEDKGRLVWSPQSPGLAHPFRMAAMLGCALLGFGTLILGYFYFGLFGFSFGFVTALAAWRIERARHRPLLWSRTRT